MSDTQREDGKMTAKDSYIIGTELMVYHDVDDQTITGTSHEDLHISVCRNNWGIPIPGIPILGIPIPGIPTWGTFLPATQY
jgi:hypothetical protein